MNSPAILKLSWIATVAMMLPMIGGLFAADHDSVSQHMSELVNSAPIYNWASKIGAFVSGAVITAFGVACFWLKERPAFSFTGLCALPFGLGMMSNGIFPMGTPLHGLYGLPIFSVLVPALFIAEFRDAFPQRWLSIASLTAAVLGLVYMWILLVGLDPAAYRGLTQRIGTVVTFGWYALVALATARKA